MITVDTFADFARRQSAIRGCPNVAMAETPNPIRQLDEVSIRIRAEAMIDAIVYGLTQHAEIIQRRNHEVASSRSRPPGVVSSARAK